MRDLHAEQNQTADAGWLKSYYYGRASMSAAWVALASV
jgi:hypothetical protein